MKHKILFLFTLIMLLFLTACEKEESHISFPFETNEVEMVEIYHYFVPEEAEKIVVTKAENIESLYSLFERIKLGKDKEEPMTGAILYFCRYWRELREL